MIGGKAREGAKLSWIWIQKHNQKLLQFHESLYFGFDSKCLRTGCKAKDWFHS